MDTAQIGKEQYILRVSTGSEVEKLLDALTRGDYLTKDELNEVGGFSWSHWVAKNWLAKNVDNVTSHYNREDKTTTLNYVEVRPRQVVQHIHEAEFSGDTQVGGTGQGTQAQDDNLQAGEIIWPDAPPMVQQDDGYKRTPFYNIMKYMVMEQGKHVSLEGPPSVGKSISVEQLAAELGQPLVNIGCDGGLRKRDLVGTPEMVNGTTKFVVGEYAAAAVMGWWVKIDEVNAADGDALLFINSQIANPFVVNIHGRQYKVHPNFRLFISYNHGLIGTKPLPQSFKDRFYPIKVSFPTQAKLEGILKARGLPADGTLGKLSRYAVLMNEAHGRGQMRYQISIRRLLDAGLLMQNGWVHDVYEALELAVVAGIDSPVEAKAAQNVLQQLKSEANNGTR